MDPSELALFIRAFTVADETCAKRIYFALREAADNLLTTYHDDPEGDLPNLLRRFGSRTASHADSTS